MRQRHPLLFEAELHFIKNVSANHALK